MNTRRMFVGLLITDVLRRHPMTTAHAFATLDRFAPNRVKLGLGAGGGLCHIPYGINIKYLTTKLEE